MPEATHVAAKAPADDPHAGVACVGWEGGAWGRRTPAGGDDVIGHGDWWEGESGVRWGGSRGAGGRRNVATTKRAWLRSEREAGGVM